MCFAWHFVVTVMLFTAIKLNHLRDNKQNDKPIRLLHFFCQLSVNHDCCVISLAIVWFSFIAVDTGCVSAKLSLYLVALPSRFFFWILMPQLNIVPSAIISLIWGELHLTEKTKNKRATFQLLLVEKCEKCSTSSNQAIQQNIFPKLSASFCSLPPSWSTV